MSDERFSLRGRGSNFLDTIEAIAVYNKDSKMLDSVDEQRAILYEEQKELVQMLFEAKMEELRSIRAEIALEPPRRRSFFEWLFG